MLLLRWKEILEAHEEWVKKGKEVYDARKERLMEGVEDQAQGPLDDKPGVDEMLSNTSDVVADDDGSATGASMVSKDQQYAAISFCHVRDERGRVQFRDDVAYRVYGLFDSVDAAKTFVKEELHSSVGKLHDIHITDMDCWLTPDILASQESEEIPVEHYDDDLDELVKGKAKEQATLQQLKLEEAEGGKPVKYTDLLPDVEEDK